MSYIVDIQPELIDWSAPINWEHSLASGLVFCTLPGMPQYEQVSKRNGTRLTNGNFVGKSQFGKAIASTVATTTGGVSFPWSEKFSTVDVDFTILVLANVTTLSTYGVLFCIPYRSAGFTSPYVSVCLQRDNATSGMQASYTHSTGPTQDALTSDTGLLATSNGMTMYAFTRQGTTGTFYRNGIQHGAAKTFASANAVDWTNKRPPVLFNQSSTSGGSSMIGQIPLCGIYNRCLTPEEIYDISNDPLAFVRRVNSFRFVPSAGGGTFTGTGACTIGAVTCSGTGTFTKPTYTATAAVTIGHPTASGSATFTKPTYTGSGAVTCGATTAAGSGTVTNPTYTGTAAVTCGGTVGSGSAIFANAVFQASAAVSIAPVTASGSATFTKPTYTGAGTASVAPAICSGSAIFSASISIGAASVTVAGATCVGSATFTPGAAAIVGASVPAGQVYIGGGAAGEVYVSGGAAGLVAGN